MCVIFLILKININIFKNFIINALFIYFVNSFLLKILILVLK